MAAVKLFQSIVRRGAAAVKLTRQELTRTGSERTLKSTFERSAAAVTLKPAVGQGSDTTTVRLQDRTTCRIEQGTWAITSDPDPQLGGSGENPEPGFLLRAALGSCYVETAALWAAKFDVPLESLEVEVESDHDARGLLGVGDSSPRLRNLRYRVTAESTAPEEDVRRVLEAARAHSPVGSSLRHAFTITHDVHIATPAAP